MSENYFLKSIIFNSSTLGIALLSGEGWLSMITLYSPEFVIFITHLFTQNMYQELTRR